MVIGDPDVRSTPRAQAWTGLLLLSAALSAAAWFGTYHQALTQRHAYVRCLGSRCTPPADQPLWLFGVATAVLVALAAAVATRARPA